MTSTKTQATRKQAPDDDGWAGLYAEVIVLGHSRMAKRVAHPLCGGSSSAWLETDAPLAVR